MAPALDVDGMIARLLNVGMAGGRLTTQVSDQELSQLCQA
uniref:Serine-threonine protein phosphatase N-terminal domain-containing protein n=2 Tax=Panagrolaimus sp. ES5 TaxID=591445 RepID=A0AC34G1P2_9BILA